PDRASSSTTAATTNSKVYPGPGSSSRSSPDAHLASVPQRSRLLTSGVRSPQRLKQPAAEHLPPHRASSAARRRCPGALSPGFLLCRTAEGVGPCPGRPCRARVEGGRRTVVLARPPAFHLPSREAAPLGLRRFWRSGAECSVAPITTPR